MQLLQGQPEKGVGSWLLKLFYALAATQANAAAGNAWHAPDLRSGSSFHAHAGPWLAVLQGRAHSAGPEGLCRRNIHRLVARIDVGIPLCLGFTWGCLTLQERQRQCNAIDTSVLLQTWMRLPWQATALPCLESTYLRPGSRSYDVHLECQSKVGLVEFKLQGCKWLAIVSFCLHADAQAPAYSSQGRPATAGQELKHQRLDPKEIARKRARDVADEAKRAAKAKEAAGMRSISTFFPPSAKRRG